MKNILIVDDDATFVSTLKAGLTNFSADFLVLTANNGRGAIQVLESTTVDLVITDLKMDGINGNSLLPQIRHLVGGHTPLIGLASEPGHSYLSECEHVIQKPFSAKELHDAISSCLT